MTQQLSPASIPLLGGCSDVSGVDNLSRSCDGDCIAFLCLVRYVSSCGTRGVLCLHDPACRVRLLGSPASGLQLCSSLPARARSKAAPSSTDVTTHRCRSQEWHLCPVGGHGDRLHHEPVVGTCSAGDHRNNGIPMVPVSAGRGGKVPCCLPSMPLVLFVHAHANDWCVSGRGEGGAFEAASSCDEGDR